MKKLNKNSEDELKAEYDLTKLTRRGQGKYAESFSKGTNLVLLDPDIAKAFPTAADVNNALRSLMPSKRLDQTSVPK